MGKPRIILAGFGAIGRMAWLPLLREAQSRGLTELAAVVDPAPGAFGRRDGEAEVDPSLRYGDIYAAIRSVQAEGIVVATPPETHEAVCSAAIGAGLHVLCEKPLAPDLASGKRIVARAKAAGVGLMVGQNRRHTRFIHAMRTLMLGRAYGEPAQTYLTFRQVFSRDSYRDSMPHPLLLDMSIHHFDSLRYVLGKEPRGVRALEWNPPWSRFKGPASAVVAFDYPDGSMAVYDASWHAMSGNLTSNGCDWRIECSEGVVLCEREEVYTAPKGRYPSGSYGGTPIPAPQEAMADESVAYLIREFLACINAGIRPETSGSDNLWTLRMVEGAVRSSESGQRVELEAIDGNLFN